MSQIFLRGASSYVLAILICALFILIFYDGYRNITAGTLILEAEHQGGGRAANLDKVARSQHQEFMGKVRELSDHTSIKEKVDPHNRHKLRWLYKAAEGAIYELAARISTNVARYVLYGHYTVVLLIGFIFVALTMAEIRGGLGTRDLAELALIYYAYIAFLSNAPSIQEWHSYIEMATIAAAIYFSLKKNRIAFLVVLFIGTSNRETGMALAVIYAFINWRERLFWLPLVLAPVFLAVPNIRILTMPEFYQLGNLVNLQGNSGYVNIWNLAGTPVSLLAFTLMKLIVAWGAIPILIYRGISTEIGRRITAVAAVYFMIVAVGNPISSLFHHTLLVPIAFALWAAAYSTAGERVRGLSSSLR